MDDIEILISKSNIEEAEAILEPLAAWVSGKVVSFGTTALIIESICRGIDDAKQNFAEYKELDQ